MQEIEAKFYTQDLKRIESRLRPPPPFGHLPQIRNKIIRKFINFYSRIWGRLGGGLIQPRILETNIRFDLPDSRLRSEGRVLRLRQDSEARLTYKSESAKEQGVSSRTEIEFTVENFEKAKLFLEALGYQKLLEYEKYRTTYELDNSHIMLDELPYGNFVEIEGENIEAIHHIVMKLGLNWNTAISESYSFLFEKVQDALHLTLTDLTFANFEGLQVSAEHLQVQRADE